MGIWVVAGAAVSYKANVHMRSLMLDERQTSVEGLLQSLLLPAQAASLFICLELLQIEHGTL